MKKNYSVIVDTEIELLETEAEKNGQHGIKTETLKNRVSKHINIESEDEDREWLLGVGFGQLIQMRLHAHGYRSVLSGYFVKLNDCTNIPYLVQMLRNQDIDVRERSAIVSNIKDMLKNYDPQISFDRDGNYNVPIPKDELMEMLDADCI